MSLGNGKRLIVSLSSGFMKYSIHSNHHISLTHPTRINLEKEDAMRASRTHRRARTMVPVSPLLRKFERSNVRKCECVFMYSPRTQAAVAVPQGDDSSTHRDGDAVATDSGTYGRFCDKSSNSWRWIAAKSPRTPSREHSEETAGTEVHDGDADLLSRPWTTVEDDLLKDLKKHELTFEKIADMFCRFAGLPKTSSEHRGEIHKRTATECARRWDDLQTTVESPEEFESPAPAQAAKRRSMMTRASTGTVTTNPIKKKKTVTNEKKKTPKATNKEEEEKPRWTHPEISLFEELIRTKAGKMPRKEFAKYASDEISAISGINRSPSAVCSQLSGRFKQLFQKIVNKDDASEVTDEEESESQLLTENTENEGSLNEPMQQERPEHENEIKMLRLRHAYERKMMDRGDMRVEMLYKQDKEMAELLNK